MTSKDGRQWMTAFRRSCENFAVSPLLLLDVTHLPGPKHPKSGWTLGESVES